MQTYEKYIEDHAEVKEWLHNRVEGTQKKFARAIMHFSEKMKIEPEEWRSLDKFEARDLAWKFLKPQIKDHSSVVHVELAALKSFYRNKRGEQLPFDSGRGGKHYFRVVRKKAAIEHIPNKKEMYALIDMASSLRDKALLLFLFQSGVRVNVLEHLTYGDVQDQLSKDTVTLKITGDLDHKLRSRDVPYYYTFLNGEGALALKRYCEVTHGKSSADTPLFITKEGSPITQRWVWGIVKNCVRKAGFNPKAISTHTIRKAFRKIARQTNIDDDDKEQLMGHVISGSRAAYFDKKDVDLLLKAYQHCNFQREMPQSETYKLREQLEMERVERGSLEKRIDALERLLKQYVNGKS